MISSKAKDRLKELISRIGKGIFRVAGGQAGAIASTEARRETPSWLIPPALPSGATVTEYTNPLTGEVFMAPSSGYRVSPEVEREGRFRQAMSAVSPGPTQARQDLSQLVGDGQPRSPYALQGGFFTGMPPSVGQVPSGQAEQSPQPSFMPMPPSPGFSQGNVPRFFREGGSVSRRELDALPGYRAGGFVPLPRILPSERRFMDERRAEYDQYNRDIEPYNQAVQQYQQQYGDFQSAYDRYVADVEAYNRAADAYNAGPRTEDFTMTQPSFTMTEPTFTATAPTAPSVSPEEFERYQNQARQRAGNRAVALDEAIKMGIVPEISRRFGRGVA
jgi:hypothetical protein